jgi:hypothetical protein
VPPESVRRLEQRHVEAALEQVGGGEPGYARPNNGDSLAASICSRSRPHAPGTHFGQLMTTGVSLVLK